MQCKYNLSLLTLVAQKVYRQQKYRKLQTKKKQNEKIIASERSGKKRRNVLPAFKRAVSKSELAVKSFIPFCIVMYNGHGVSCLYSCFDESFPTKLENTSQCRFTVTCSFNQDHYPQCLSTLFCRFISFYNIDRSLRALWWVKNPCFITVKNIEKACFIVRNISIL